MVPISMINHLVKNHLNKNILLQQIAYYASDRKKNPHEAKQKEIWSKNKSKTKEIKIQEKIDENFLNRKIVDSVWSINDYPTQKYDLETIIKFHKEVAQENMLNNMNGLVTAKILIDMKTKKKGKFLDSIKLNIKYPYDYPDGIKKEVIAICKTENEIKAAKEAGALFAGYEDVLKMFERGDITDASFDVIVCTPETLNDVTLLKKKINKDRLPSLKSKTVGENLFELVNFHRLSKVFESTKVNDEISTLKANIGMINMKTNELEENFKELIRNVQNEAKIDKNEFIKACKLFCAPSTESFLINLDFLLLVISDKNNNKNIRENKLIDNETI